MKFTNLFLFGLLSVSLLITSCSEEESEQTLDEVIEGRDEYSSLAAALEVTGLDETLSSGTYTVFAPSDAAFSSFLQAEGFASLDEVPVATLTSILLNHVVPGSVRSTQLTPGYINNALDVPGEAGAKVSMYIDLRDGVRINGVSTVNAPDIEAENGIIHGVNSVIGLPTVVTFATADPNFTSLVAALTREPSFTFVDILSSDGPFTVFAPDNEAFSDLIGELQGINTLDDIPSTLLSSVLSYHVVANDYIRSSELSNQTLVNSFEGSGFTVVIDANNNVTLVDENNRGSNVKSTDVNAINGVIHVIDTVILPN